MAAVEEALAKATAPTGPMYAGWGCDCPGCIGAHTPHVKEGCDFAGVPGW